MHSSRGPRKPALPKEQAAPAVPSDPVLVAAARANAADFAPLFERYVALVYRYCHVRLGQRETAEDATSETFLKALAGLDGYRGGSFPAWLFRIAHNIVADIYRRRPPTQPLDTVDPLDSAGTPEDLVLARADQAALRVALTALPEAQRLVVELRIAGWPDATIAAVLDRSTDAVKMIRLRALKQLRALLAEPGEQPEHGGRDDRA